MKEQFIQFNGIDRIIDGQSLLGAFPLFIFRIFFLFVFFYITKYLPDWFKICSSRFKSLFDEVEEVFLFVSVEGMQTNAIE
jgi:hypothetical protein